MTRSNHGGGDYDGVRTINVTAEGEFRAFDQLGPNLRDLINYGVLSYSAITTLQKILRAGGDPQDPAYDAKIAAMLATIDNDLRHQLIKENENAAESGDIGRAIAKGFHDAAVRRSSSGRVRRNRR